MLYSELEATRSTDLLAAVEDSIGTPNDCLSSGERAEGKADPGSEIQVVRRYQATRRAISICHDQLRGLIVEITLLVVYLHKRRE